MAQISIFAVQFNVKTYNYNNGLISGSNNFTYQSVDGFYWICSFGGLVRFDGENFKSFRNSDGLTNYRVNGFFEESNNKYLICNEYNLLSFNGNTFKKLKTNLPVNTIYYNLLQLTDKSILLQTNSGYYKKLNDTIFYSFTINNESINLLAEYQKGKFIAYVEAQRKILITDESKKIITVKIPNDIKLRSFLNFDNEPLLSTNKGIFEIRNNSLTNYLPEKFSVTKKINSIFRDSKNRIWVTDEQNQLWLFDGNNWENQTIKYKTKELPLATIFEDKNNNIAVTSLLGLTIYRESYFKYTLTSEINNTNYNYRISEYNSDTLCIGINNKGLVLVHNGNEFIKPLDLKIANLKDETLPSIIYKNEKNKNQKILIIRRNGIYNIENNKLIPFCKIKSDFSIIGNGYYNSSQNCFYCGNNNYVFIFYPNKIDTVDFSTIAPNLNPHDFIIMEDGTFFFTATHQKLIQFKNNKLSDFTNELKLNGKDFFITKNKNLFWVSILGIELRIYSFTNNHFKLEKIISTKNGLLDANIAEIKFDEHDNLWLNCFSGIYFLKPDFNKNTYYSKKIPLLNNTEDVSMINDLFYTNNQLYATDIGKFFSVDCNKVTETVLPFSTYLSSVKINQHDLNTLLQSQQIKKLQGKYILPPTFNSISFQAYTTYFGYDESIGYQYQLKSDNKSDTSWKSIEKSNIISFNDLQSGSYIFKIRSIHKISNVAFSVTTFPFIIKPPFWKTFWFRFLLALICIFLIYWYIKRRDIIKENKNKLALQMSELKLTALQSQMNPHFIFNSMNSIQNYILQQKPIEAARYLSKFSKLMRRVLDQSFTNLAPIFEIIETLNMYLELEALRFNNEFNWEIIVDESDKFNEVKLPPMLIQPYVENAIIHGLMPKNGEKKLIVHISLINNILHCIIDDNGVGRNENKEENKKHVSRGQKLTTDMLSTLKQLLNTETTIDIIDKKDEIGNRLGTTIEIKVPLKD